MGLPSIKLNRGIHVLHLFYGLDRVCWSGLTTAQRAAALTALDTHAAAHSAASHPRLSTYVNVGGKADLAFMLLAADLVQLSAMHRQLEACFPPGALRRIDSFLSVTELPEYVTTEDDTRRMLEHHEKLAPGSESFETRLTEWRTKQAEYEHYRLYPELPDWEVMAFYPMNKRRQGTDNWYAMDFAARKKLMGGHARVGRKYAGRIVQLISGSTGLDDWEWGVTLVAHQIDAFKEIVYEMRFDEVSARYGDFGRFYINLRLTPAQAWEHLGLG
jgi:chlorite dismutase